MIDLLKSLREVVVQPGQLAVCSLGQAGFIYKTESGRYIVIDPYLSDYCEHRIGREFKRLMPSLLTPQELEALPIAAYLLTHQHEDHLDVETIQAISDATFPFYAPPDSIQMLSELGIAGERCQPLFEGAHYELDGIVIKGVHADHGDIAPDAVGIIVQYGGKTIYHMGDTCLHADKLHLLSDQFNIDVVIAPINGRYGNMNEADAISAVSILQPRYAVPCHFWMLPGNSGGDPVRFLDGVDEQAPNTKAMLVHSGEIFIV
ncbi:hypothetical protein A8709_15220 [Paenibacillus pectinilyticus]|uniref:Metallo-beta-lactamase domain-containing protein n=1 Tax=Paenibacillus pectinilyticus TaxID=512399 RepID=A0A1C1A4E5_9BACL|nr:MBL fold metallo-hydrolase [Paenibacillus pectinilyticus]OCT15429.1 hypothetical protein A8709_15220 [Paenibacillus pectinilyticus]